MSDHLTEEEQIQRIKDFWKQYGNAILTGVTVVALSFAGFRFWQNHQYQLAVGASKVYQTLMINEAKGDFKAVATQGEYLKKQYPKSPYAFYGAFFLAKDAVNRGDLKTAQSNLQWVMVNANDQALKQVARLRLARLFIAHDNPTGALSLLRTQDDPNFTSLVNEVRGDAYASLNQKSEAVASYEIALKAIPPQEVPRPLLKMKLAELQ